MAVLAGVSSKITRCLKRYDWVAMLSLIKSLNITAENSLFRDFGGCSELNIRFTMAKLGSGLPFIC